MTWEEGEDKVYHYIAICIRANAFGIMEGNPLNAIIDIDSADQKFNLRLDDFLNADEENFKHDFAGIQRNIVRNQYPAIDFGDFVPRFAGRDA